ELLGGWDQVAQLPTQQLASRRVRQRVDQVESVGALQAAETFFGTAMQRDAKIVRRGGDAPIGHDERDRTFTEARVVDADHCNLPYAGDIPQRCFNLLRVEVHAARDDHVVQTVGQVQ